MSDTAEFYDSNLWVTEVLRDFHDPAVDELPDGQLVTACPYCAKRMFVSQTYVMCESKTCEFRAGTAIDLLAAIEGDYWRAIKVCARAYPSRFSEQTEEHNEEVVAALQRRRALFDFICNASAKAFSLANIDVVQARSYLKNLGIDIDRQPFSVMVLEREELAEFMKLADAAAETRLPRVALGDNHTALLIPLYASPCVIAGFIAMPTNRPREVRISHLGRFKFGFTGLLDMHPMCRNIELFTGFTAALSSNTANGKVRRDFFSTAVYHDPRGRTCMWQPYGATFQYRNEAPAILSGLAELAHGNDLKVFRGKAEPSTWQEFALDLVTHYIEEAGGVTNAVAMCISALRLNESDHFQLIDRLNQSGRIQWAFAVDRLRQTQLLFVGEKKTAYYKHAGGYYAIRSDGSRVDLTNFLVNFEGNVTFADTNITVSAGTMLFRGHQYPITFQSGDWNSPLNIEQAARAAESKMPGLSGKVMPQLRDRTYGRVLGEWLRRQAGEAMGIEGLDGLGWTRSNSSFFAPWGKISEREWDPRVRTPNPAYDFWSHYDLDHQPIPLEPFAEDIPIEVADIISSIIGAIGRGYSGMKVKPLAYLYTQDSNFVLRNIFRALGQISPVPFNAREGSGLTVAGLNGFPMLVTGATTSQLEMSLHPFFALSDAGIPFYSSISEEQLSRVMRMLPWLVQTSIQWIIATKGREVKMFNSVHMAATLSREGAQIIKLAAGLDWPLSTPNYATLERLLNQIPFTRGEEYFTQDLGAQTITISLQGVRDVDEADLYHELRRHAHQVTHANGAFTVDAISLAYLITNFYGAWPPMRVVGLRAVSA